MEEVRTKRPTAPVVGASGTGGRAVEAGFGRIDRPKEDIFFKKTGSA
jgi:hypothetical protein